MNGWMDEEKANEIKYIISCEIIAITRTRTN
jgi:hypothetical protein